MAGSLWSHRDFLLLWLGQSVSRVGDQFTGLAIPIIAAFSLGAGPVEMGLLGAAATFPFLLFGLLVGVWVDRRRRRAVLVRADLGRGAMVGAVAILGLAGLLHMVYLYVFAFAVGVLTVFFDVAYQAYLPSLVERRQLVDANSKLETSNSLAVTGGPTLAGAVIEVLTAPVAMVFDAASFAFSAATLLAIRRPESPPDPKGHAPLLREIREGLAVVSGDRRLRHIALCTAWSNFFSNIVFAALIVLYLKNALHAGPFEIGLFFGIGSVGGIAGAVSASRISRRIGVGPAIVFGAAVSGFALVPFPFLDASVAYAGGIGLFALVSFGVLVYNINQVSYRQALVPLRLQGRLNATMRTIVWGTIPLGALAGGALGSALGVRQGIVVGALGGAASFLWVLASPVWRVREIPESSA